MRETYEDAVRETEGRLSRFLEQFEKSDRQYRAMVENGSRTHSQYEAWRRDQVINSRRWQEVLRELTLDMEHSAEIAMDVVNGELPDVYAVSHDFGTYEIESGTGISTMYNLYDRDTVLRLIAEEPDLYPQASVNVDAEERWDRRHITSAVTQGLLQGDTMEDIAKRMRRVCEMSESSAMRAARTCVTSAENSGRVKSYQRAQDMGIKVRKQWLATLDERTRSSHRALDGESVDVDDTFSNGLRYPGDPSGSGSEVYNCFLGDVNVDSDSEIVRSYKSLYIGETITVDTAAGVHFTCTPNHPILTDRGWVPARLLNDGDNLLVTFRTGTPSGPDPDVQHGFASFEAVHELLHGFGCERASALCVNFHGDRPASDVEIVGKEGLLRVCGDVTGIEEVDELLLELTDPSASAVGSVCELPGGCTALRPSDMGGFRDALLLVLGHRGHADVHRLGSVPRSDATVAEDAIDNLPAETMCRRELLGGLSGKVTIDKVISVKVGSTRGSHVYNLQTGDGYYFVSSIMPGMDNGVFAIAKNCRCTMIADLSEYPREQVSRFSRLKDMSYNEWRGEHEERTIAPPTSPAPVRYGEFRGLSYVDDGLGAHAGDGSDLDPVRMVAEDTGFDDAKARQVIRDVSRWVGNDYTRIRAHDPSTEDVRERLEEFLEASPKYEGTVWRGVGLERADAEDVLQALRTGDEIDQRGVSSWATESDWATEFAEMNVERRDDGVSIVFRLDENRSGVSIKHVASIDNDEVVAPEGVSYVLNGEIEWVEDPYDGDYWLVPVKEVY